MIKCKTDKQTCPFLSTHRGYNCSLDYTIDVTFGITPISKDCKLEVVQWATNKTNSETFIPNNGLQTEK